MKKDHILTWRFAGDSERIDAIGSLYGHDVVFIAHVGQGDRMRWRVYGPTRKPPGQKYPQYRTLRTAKRRSDRAVKNLIEQLVYTWAKAKILSEFVR